jgi:tRNA nucleotidyltransferase (CCA-adding enzyme)
MEIITTHRNTDFDGLASVVAATLLYPDARVMLPNSLNPNVRAFVSIHKDHFNFLTPKEINPEQVQRLVVVDTNRWGRLDSLNSLRNRDELEVIVWDHHGNFGDIRATTDHQASRGATATIIIEELVRRGAEPSPIQATLFLTGIYEDTGALTFQSTTAADARAAAFCLDHGADLAIVNSFLRMAYNEEQKETLFEIFKRAEEEQINGFRVCIYTHELSGHVEGLAVVIRMLRELMNVDAAFGVFHQRKKNKCMVIGRSIAQNLDVGSILRGLGGGGHPGAGAARVDCDDPVEVAGRLRKHIENYRGHQARISDLMSFPVTTIQADASMRNASELLEKSGCTGLPVMDGDQLVGIISRRDFRKVRSEKRLASPVKAYMSRAVKTIGPDRRPLDAARLMVRHDLGRLPVVADGQLIGIVTRTDTMRYYYDLLPD